MAQSNHRRRFLNIVILISVIGIAIGMAPTVMQRLEGVSDRQVSDPEQTGWVDATTRTSRQVDGGLQETDAPGLTASHASGQGLVNRGSLDLGEPQLDRHVEQAQVIRDELVRRERSVAAREEILRQQVLEEFWKRQAAASAATVAVTLLLVVLVARRMGDWTGFSKRLQNEESRMRNLQLSVIGALEEFESEVAAARAWAAAEARARRPVGDGPLQAEGTEAREPSEAQVPETAVTNAGERLFPKPAISQAATLATPALAEASESESFLGRPEIREESREQRTVEAMTSRPEQPLGIPGASEAFGAFAIEESQNQAWPDMPKSEEPSPSVEEPPMWDVTRKAAESIRSGIASQEEQPDAEPAEHPGISSPGRTYPSEDILGPPRPLRREPEQRGNLHSETTIEPDAEEQPTRPWSEIPAEGTSRQSAQQSVWQAACNATRGDLQVDTGSSAREKWVRRFLESEPDTVRLDHIDQAQPESSGPWDDWTARREGSMPPSASPQSGARPGVREQVEYLASEGFPEREIARRLGLSREEVQLALSLGRRSRVAAVRRGEVDAPGNAAARAGWGNQEQTANEADR